MKKNYCPVIGRGRVCPFWVDGFCLAEQTYGVLLNHWCPDGAVLDLPFGLECLPIQKALTKTICKEIRKHVTLSEEKTEFYKELQNESPELRPAQANKTVRS